ncbi:MAG: type VII secretion protein EccB [Actinomycetota bacterium]|nr:type VII secretion protein EccB [Actinomycetota bacterium]
MSSNRVLLEAEAHHRRRALAALLTADAEGSDEALPRSTPLLWGLALAVGVLVGVLVSGLLTTTPPPGWDDGRLVVARGSAARFVGLRGTLYPVLNTTSARLVLPVTSGLTVQVVDDASIAAAPHGPTLGIPGAPDELPPAAGLLPSGWVACLDGSQVRTTLSSRAAPPRSVGLAMTVRVAGAGGTTGHLLASGRRFALPNGHEEPVTRFIGLSAPPLAAPQRWVDLFTEGTPLDHRAFRFPSDSPAGQPPPGVTVGGRAQQVGQLLANTDHAGALSVLLADGTVPLTPFGGAVYRATAPRAMADPRPVTDVELASTPISAVRGFVPDDWPRTLSAAASGTPCARLDAAGGRAALIDLLLQDRDSLWVHPPGGLPVTVDPGHGAVVRAGTSPGVGRVFLVDASGVACPVADPSSETLARLGYATVQPLSVPSVPSPWLALFRPGPELSREAAGGPSG